MQEEKRLHSTTSPVLAVFTSAAANPRQTLSANMEKHLKHNLGLRIDPQVGYPHPYEYELHLLEYPEEQLRPVKERLYQPFSEYVCSFAHAGTIA